MADRQYKAPRGTGDILPGDQAYWHHVVATAERLCGLYGYERIDTPTFEDAGIFLHGTGDSTDIVNREMYLFEDRGGDRLALRPEGTPNVVRAYLEHGLFNQPQPVKLFYFAPAFRYERPQSGRYREHHQLGLEAIGDVDPSLDAELIDFTWQLYTQLGLTGLTVLLNSIGDGNCRPQYVALLRDYYRGRMDEVCGECKIRFEKNPLRLLDCKVPSCQPLIRDAPTIANHLCDPCREHLAAVRRHLDAFGVRYEMASRLVRGLDYYTRTVFEVVPENAGSTGTIGAGGRYDGLVEILGGKPTPGVGFATGIERIVLNLRKAQIPVPALAAPRIYIAYADPSAHDEGVALCGALRHSGIGALVAGGGRSLKAQLRSADRSPAEYTLILGGEGGAQLKHMQTGEQETVDPASLFERLRLG